MHDSDMVKIRLVNADGRGESFWARDLGDNSLAVNNVLISPGLGLDDVVVVDDEGEVIHIVERSDRTTTLVGLLPFDKELDADVIEAGTTLIRHICETAGNAGLGCQMLPMPGAALIQITDVVTVPVLVEHAATAYPIESDIVTRVTGGQVLTDVVTEPSMPTGDWRRITEALFQD